MNVTNAKPTGTFNSPASGQAGVPFTLSITSPSDPSAADTAAGFTYAFDCGSGYGAFSHEQQRDVHADDGRAGSTWAG